MIKNSDTIVSILIPVTKNEASCLPDTLRSVRNDVIRYGKKAEIIVIANCCKGTSDEVAQAIFSESAFKDSLVTGKVIHCETPGKMFAVNDGIDVEGLLIHGGAPFKFKVKEVSLTIALG